MNSLLIAILALSVGFIALSFSADRLIATSATFAKHCNVSLIFIGMTVVAFGTSAPELLVSAVAALNGAGQLAIGNGIGSNIVNVGLVLAVCMLLTPMAVHQRFIKREFPILIVSVLISIALMSNGQLTTTDSLLLTVGLLGYCVYLAKSVKQGETEPEELEFLNMSKTRAGWESFVMLMILLCSSQLMVWGAVELARLAGISELVIGLTIIAFGTSLPELAAAIAGVRRGMYDIAFATVIGSNIFNLLGVIAFPSLLGDKLPIPNPVLNRDLPIMALLTLILGLIFAISLWRSRSSGDSKQSYKIGRAGGGVLLVVFSTYLIRVAATLI